MMNVKRRQVGGTHYNSRAIQPIDYIQANGLGFCEGSVLKYITRHRDMDKIKGKQDIQKAMQYLEFILEEYDNDN